MKKIVRKFLQGCSLTAAMFVFQACYGTEHDWGEPLRLTFQVVDENNNTIEGVNLQSRWEYRNSNGELTSYSNWKLLDVSEDNGVLHADIYEREFPNTRFQFSDEQGRFEHLDTIFSSMPETDTINITLKIKTISHE